MTDSPSLEKTTPPSPSEAAALLDRVQAEVRRVIVGQDRPIERLMVALLSKGHVLLEGVPGLAKTLAAETLARTVGGTFSRIQFTPDLLPADVMGTRIFRASKETFDIELGPVFVNFLLADEINRAPAKVQSALLEVMAERQVSIGGKTFPVPDPFLVLATQNPIESEGVYPLPEAQRDRFLMKITVDYPTAGEEVDIVYRMGVRPPEAETVLSLEDLISLQGVCDAVRVDRAVVDYAVTVVLATRYPGNYALSDIEPLLTFGGSPRASLGLVRAGRALALLRGRDHIVPQDVFDVAPDVLRHRLVLSYEALAQGVTPDQILARVLSTVPAPRRVGQGASAFGPSAAEARPEVGHGAANGTYGAQQPGYGAAAAGYGGPQGYPQGYGTAQPAYGGAPQQPGYGAAAGPATGTYGAPQGHGATTATGYGSAQPGPAVGPSDASPFAPPGASGTAAGAVGPATGTFPGPVGPPPGVPGVPGQTPAPPSVPTPGPATGSPWAPAEPPAAPAAPTAPAPEAAPGEAGPGAAPDQPGA